MDLPHVAWADRQPASGERRADRGPGGVDRVRGPREHARQLWQRENGGAGVDDGHPARDFAVAARAPGTAPDAGDLSE